MHVFLLLFSFLPPFLPPLSFILPPVLFSLLPSIPPITFSHLSSLSPIPLLFPIPFNPEKKFSDLCGTCIIHKYIYLQMTREVTKIFLNSQPDRKTILHFESELK